MKFEAFKRKHLFGDDVYLGRFAVPNQLFLVEGLAETVKREVTGYVQRTFQCRAVVKEGMPAKEVLMPLPEFPAEVKAMMGPLGDRSPAVVAWSLEHESPEVFARRYPRHEVPSKKDQVPTAGKKPELSKPPVGTELSVEGGIAFVKKGNLWLASDPKHEGLSGEGKSKAKALESLSEAIEKARLAKEAAEKKPELEKVEGEGAKAHEGPEYFEVLVTDTGEGSLEGTVQGEGGPVAKGADLAALTVNLREAIGALPDAPEGCEAWPIKFVDEDGDPYVEEPG